MSNIDQRFDKQELLLKDLNRNVRLLFENWSATDKQLLPEKNDVIIYLSEPGKYDSVVKVEIADMNKNYSFFIMGIEGGGYLHGTTPEENYCTVKIENGNLFLSLGSHFFSINVETCSLNWILKPDISTVFEFYELESDFLVRGEIGIHRISRDGELKWSYTAKDIWVNLEEENEVEILENKIKLTDFELDTFYIDYSGKEISNFL